ncbi:MAG: LamG domain-containing protein [Prevotellaceae bacterium]|jgi:hypothetical protein|nr:LamG domain-containing protein [Prevotellaceae bacterium]
MKKKSWFWIWSILIAVTILSSCKKEPLDEIDPEGRVHGPVAYYTFDNETAEDLSIHGYDGSLINNPEFITDTPNGSGKAIFFRAVEKQYLNIPYDLFEGLTKYSILFWIKDFRDGFIFSGMGAETYRGDNYPQLICADGLFAFSASGFPFYIGASVFSYGATAIQDGQWHFLGITCSRKGVLYNGAQWTIKLYVDGRLADTTTEDALSPAQPITKFQFGGNGNGMHNISTNVTATNLKIDNIRVYDRELSAKDVKTLYDSER